jgi:hypothetical protein
MKSQEDVLVEVAGRLEEARVLLDRARTEMEREERQAGCTHDFAYFGDSVECKKCGYREYCG